MPKSIAPGTVIVTDTDTFEIVGEVGRGGMGVVYKATQLGLDRFVAIKTLTADNASDQAALQRLIREGRLSGALDHPNIVRVHSLTADADGQPLLIMEFVEGQTLSQIVEETGPLNEQRFLEIFNQVLSALEHAHEHGFVHRDLKPSNVMVTADGGVKLMDFGIAKDVIGSLGGTQGMTQTGVLLGSPWYMSPEQCRGETLDGRSDLYSLGCVMYECLLGQQPFFGETAFEVMFKHIHEQLSTTTDLKIPCYGDVIVKAMNKDLSERYQSVSEMRDALMRGKEDPVRRNHHRRKIATARVRRKTIKIVAGGSIVMAIIAFVLLGPLRPVPQPQHDNQSAFKWKARADAEYKLVATANLSIPQREIHRREAVRLYKRALRSNPNSHLEAELSLSAAAAMDMDSPQQAERLFKDAIAFYEKQPSSEDHLNALCALSNYYIVHREYQNAEETTKRALALIQNIDKENAAHLKGICLFNLASCAASQKQFPPATDYIRQAIALAGTDQMRAAYQARAVDIWWGVGKLKEAVELAEQNVKQFEAPARTDASLVPPLFQTYQWLSNYYSAKSDATTNWGRLKDCTLRVIELDSKLRCLANSEKGDLYYRLIRCYIHDRNSPDAIKAATEAEKYLLLASNPRPHSLLSVYSWLLYLNLGQGEFDKALVAGNKRLALCQTPGFPKIHEIVSLNEIGLAYFKKNDLPEAEKMLLRAEALEPLCKDPEPTNDDYLLTFLPLTEVEAKLGKWDQVDRYIPLMRQRARNAVVRTNLPGAVNALAERLEKEHPQAK